MLWVIIREGFLKKLFVIDPPTHLLAYDVWRDLDAKKTVNFLYSEPKLINKIFQLSKTILEQKMEQRFEYSTKCAGLNTTKLCLVPIIWADKEWFNIWLLWPQWDWDAKKPFDRFFEETLGFIITPILEHLFSTHKQTQ